MSVYPVILSQTKFIHRDSLNFPFEERGFQFGDGIYEVIRIYDGKYYLLEEHIDRLFRSADSIKIELPFTKDECTTKLLMLLDRNNMNSDGKVYLQVSRGSAPRNHVFPIDTVPNIYAYVENAARPLDMLSNGVGVITHPDRRWDFCFIKSINLLPNVLAKQEAKEHGCYEAILHKDGLVTECSSSNVYLIKNGEIYTHPPTKSILHGCVRMRVEQFAEELNIPFNEEAFTLDDINEADELFLSSSTSEIMPIVMVDGNTILDGKPGPVTERLQKAYEKDANIYQAKKVETSK